jgi:NAD(P)-dependent dehydrogenase (short-subunit alcohol dehydrogenase family)
MLNCVHDLSDGLLAPSAPREAADSVTPACEHETQGTIRLYRRGRASRTVVITGSASGLGRALRRRLVDSGCRVIGIDLEGEEVAADLGSPQGRVAAMNAVLDETHRVIDGLVLCAGLGPDDAPAARLVAVNYYGAVSVLDGLRPGLAAGAQPSAVAVVPNTVGIVPISDASLIDALNEEGEAESRARSEAFDPASVHAMTKLALTRAVRLRTLEWGRSGIRLNVVARGPFAAPPRLSVGSDPSDADAADAATDLGEPTGRVEHPAFGSLAEALPIPLDRRASPDDVASVVRFLLGRESAMVHGSVLFCDGGTDALLRPDHI